jgi:acetolactate synthase I/II/III large subunit
MELDSVSIGGLGGRVLVASCLGDDTGGGLYTYDGHDVQTIDRLSTTGLYTTGNRLIRLIWCASETQSSTEILIYDHHGIRHYHRLDNVADPHDVLWDGNSIVVVATRSNDLVWLDKSGEIEKRWHAPGDGDAWHLNSLLMSDGKLLVCAFGQFASDRGWSGSARLGSGVVVDVYTRQTILSGLSCPHTPRFVDGNWLICNSATQELLLIAADGRTVRRRLKLNGWTRGLTITDDLVFVGESANRLGSTAGATATVAVVSRDTWEVLGRLELPAREIYDIVLVDRDLIEGIRCGFRTNTQRVNERDQLALFDAVGVQPTRLWASGDPLRPEECRVTIDATTPVTMEPGKIVEIQCVVTNGGTAPLVSAPPNPVHLSYKWLDPDSRTGRPDIEGWRTRLPRALFPGQHVIVTLRVQAPNDEGSYILKLTAVQEQVAWFDNLSAENQSSGLVHVVEAGQADNTT